MANGWGEKWKQWQTIFSWAPKSLQMVMEPMKLKDARPWKKSYNKLKECIKKQRHHFANKGVSSQSYGFSSGHVQMWELDHKEGWASKNWCFQTLVLENTLRSPLGSKEIKPVNPKGNQSWIFIERTDAEGEAPVLEPFDEISQLIEKDSDAEKDWEQGEKEAAEDGWMASLTQWTWVWVDSRRCEGQGSLVCCSLQGLKKLDMTEQLRTNKLRGSIDSFNTLSVSANYRQSTGLYAVDANMCNFWGSILWANVSRTGMSISPLFDQQICYCFTHHMKRRRKMCVKQFVTIPGRGKELKEIERERGAASILCSSIFSLKLKVKNGGKMKRIG